ncbi:MAG: ExbD/TolR family protein [Rhodoferax sp.]
MTFGRLERRAGPAPMSDINMTPLIDVMLVLVVILIITAPLLASSIKLDLPKADAAKTSAVARSITVVVDAAGQAYLQDQAVTLEELTRQFTLARQDYPDTEVQLRADKSVPYGRIVAVMGTAQQAGLSRLGFVADNNPAAPAPAAAAPMAASPGRKP